jgi:diguanylate cyclase (GGDEF)-like protein
VPTPSPSDPFLELLAETLENLDRSPRGQFLQRFFATVAQLDLNESASLEYWDQILERRRQLSEGLGKPISLKTAMVDVLASLSDLRLPILMEYAELKKLQINAATDPLTGLYNRRLFEEQFEKELNRAQRYSEHLALVVLDLHRFKEVNDLYGHPRGDALLQMAATTLRKSLRISDYAFRIGGDEFALLLVQSDTDQADTLARRLRTNFAAAIEPMQMTVTLGLDYGVSVYPNDGDQREILVRIADQRLYEMKNALRAALQRPLAYPSASPPLAAELGDAPASPPIGQESIKKQPFAGSERRKWERVSFAGTRAHAQLVDNRAGTAKVLDLGYGGLALEIEVAAELGATFPALLRVPILPPLRVSLKRLYQIRSESGQMRVGCAFVT